MIYVKAYASAFGGTPSVRGHGHARRVRKNKGGKYSMLSICCRKMTVTRKLPEVTLNKCKKCSTWSVNHGNFLSKVSDRPWDSPGINTVFLNALAKRRKIQAGKIISFFFDHLKDGKLLDYSCGQGTFLNEARLRGLDCHGTDIELLDTQNLKNNIEFVHKT